LLYAFLRIFTNQLQKATTFFFTGTL